MFQALHEYTRAENQRVSAALRTAISTTSAEPHAIKGSHLDNSDKLSCVAALLVRTLRFDRTNTAEFPRIPLFLSASLGTPVS